MVTDLMASARRAAELSHVPWWARPDATQDAAVAILERPWCSEGEAITVGIYAARDGLRALWASRGGADATLMDPQLMNEALDIEHPPEEPLSTEGGDYLPRLWDALTSEEWEVLDLRTGFTSGTPCSSTEIARSTGRSISKCDRLYRAALSVAKEIPRG